MANPNPRSADASIAGYLYQFDKSILEVLKAPDDATVVLEGYEDVDLRNAGNLVAIQCKYHEAGKFSAKGIRDPLRAMLKTFDEGHEFQYRLYGHYGQQEEEIPKHLTLEELRKALTKEGKKGTIRYYESFGTPTLEGFLNHFEIIDGPSRSDQREAVLAELKSVLGGSDDDASELHYPNAVSVVLDMAASPDEAARTVQRADFIDALDKRKDLFTRWHREFLGTDRYLKSVERRIKSLDLVKSTLRRVIILGSDELASASATTRAIDVIKQVASLRFGVGHLAKARPWTVVVEAEPGELTEIKEALIRDGLAFRDGFENVLFSPDIFDRPVIINTGKQHKKISAVSFDLRLVGLSTLQTNIENIAAPDVVLSFRKEPIDLPWVGQPPRELNVAGCDLDQLAELVGRLA
jgi:hypothetical protein